MFIECYVLNEKSIHSLARKHSLCLLQYFNNNLIYESFFALTMPLHKLCFGFLYTVDASRNQTEK